MKPLYDYCRSDTIHAALAEVAQTFKCRARLTVVHPDDLIDMGEMRDGLYYDPLMLWVEEQRDHMTGKVDWL
jgi:hypothetical protein